jgi:hypothetical protein
MNLSTKDKQLSTIASSDVESGWLGRWLFLTVPERRKFKDAVEELGQNTTLVHWVEQMVNMQPPLPSGHDDVWEHPTSGRTFHVLRFTQDALKRLSALDDELDQESEDRSTHPIERTVKRRTLEMVVRLAQTAGLADRINCGSKVGITSLAWAELIARSSINFIAPALVDGIKDENNLSVLVESKVQAQFAMLAKDQKKRRSAGKKVKDAPLGNGVAIQKTYLVNLVKGSRRELTSTVTRREIEEMIQLDKLAMVKDGRTQWLLWLG